MERGLKIASFIFWLKAMGGWFTDEPKLVEKHVVTHPPLVLRQCSPIRDDQ